MAVGGTVKWKTLAANIIGPGESLALKLKGLKIEKSCCQSQLLWRLWVGLIWEKEEVHQVQGLTGNICLVPRTREAQWGTFTVPPNRPLQLYLSLEDRFAL